MSGTKTTGKKCCGTSDCTARSRRSKRSSNGTLGGGQKGKEKEGMHWVGDSIVQTYREKMRVVPL